MAMPFAVSRLFLVSKREADRPRLARTGRDCPGPGGVRTIPIRKQARQRSRSEYGPTRPAA